MSTLFEACRISCSTQLPRVGAPTLNTTLALVCTGQQASTRGFSSCRGKCFVLVTAPPCTSFLPRRTICENIQRKRGVATEPWLLIQMSTAPVHEHPHLIVHSDVIPTAPPTWFPVRPFPSRFPKFGSGGGPFSLPLRRTKVLERTCFVGQDES